MNKNEQHEICTYILLILNLVRALRRGFLFISTKIENAINLCTQLIIKCLKHKMN